MQSNPVITGDAERGVAFIAPSGRAPDPASITQATRYFVEQGWRVVNLIDPEHFTQRFGDTDSGRLAQLHAAAARDDVTLVLALRGGYGISRLIDRVDIDLLANSGKLFVGYSDFTPIHQVLAARGVASLAGPMLCDDFGRSEPVAFTMQSFWACVGADEHTVSGRSDCATSLDLEGKLWGGNLAMLAHSVGAPWFAPIEDGILFLEDIAEHPFRVERMLLQLLYAGVLSRQRAIVLGDFSGYRLAEIDHGYDFDAMLAYIRSRVACPIITGLQFGHVPQKLTLAVGAQSRLTKHAHDWQLTMRGYQPRTRG